MIYAALFQFALCGLNAYAAVKQNSKFSAAISGMCFGFGLSFIARMFT